MANLTEVVFQNEITEQALESLKLKYPPDLVVDMTVEEEFKRARKIRTERNKLISAIDRRRIDFTSEIKATGDDLIARVNDIYSVIVSPFEVQDEIVKKLAAEEKARKQQLIDKELNEIQKVRSFIDDCRGKDSTYIQNTIEAVDMFEAESFSKDVIHEAIAVKKATIDALAQILMDSISREKLQAEREELEKLKADLDQQKRQQEAANAKAEEQAEQEAQHLEPVIQKASNETQFMQHPTPAKKPALKPRTDYEQGFIDGITSCAFIRNNVAYVGENGLTLEEAVSEFLRSAA